MCADAARNLVLQAGESIMKTNNHENKLQKNKLPTMPGQTRTEKWKDDAQFVFMLMHTKMTMTMILATGDDIAHAGATAQT